MALATTAHRPVSTAECPVMAATEVLAAEGGIEARGAIFTRPEVVDFILDLVGYTEDQPLHEKRLLEPSFGGGDFLLPIIKRLLSAWRAARPNGSALDELADAIRAVELHHDTFRSTRTAVVDFLKREGMAANTATALAGRWLSQGDFLLTVLEGEFDFVVGNPPYVRQELIPAPLLVEYRSRYPTMYDRADIYIPFIERSLSVLSQDGNLGFICADRWMKNRYGGPLRRLVAERFHLKVYVDMVDTRAFHSDVIAYPAITIISREVPGATRVAHRPAIDRATLASLASVLRAPALPQKSGPVRELARVTNGAEPWLLGSFDQMALIRRLERAFPLLEEAGCKVGIGVATGADKAFIGDFEALDVEHDRKLPLVTTKDIMSGEVKWRGQGVINPFAESGGLVDLNEYPRLRRYLEARREVIAGRHCAQKAPANWYRTIDRITPVLTARPKLLIPDIKGEAHIVFEGGELYPHHNLYFVTSDDWDLRALQAVLLSAVTRLFVATYSTKMRGGFLRFQAQYLRRIRIPRWEDVPERLRRELAEAAVKRDLQACNRAVFKLYGLSHKERSALGGNGEYMALDLVNYEQKAREAVKAFWGNRAAATQKNIETGKADQGERAGVTAGKNMDGFLALVLDIIKANGLAHAEIHQNRAMLTLPGYFRPTKLWDLLVIHKGELIAAIELKSQVGPSFGNNFNNRTEEAIGTAHDLWTAFREEAFGKQPRPFVGWLMMVEDAPESRRPVRDSSPHFPVFKEFQGASYLQRYDLLCQRLVQEQLYTTAAVITAERSAVDTGDFKELSPMTSLKTFVAALAGHVAAEAARLG